MIGSVDEGLILGISKNRGTQKGLKSEKHHYLPLIEHPEELVNQCSWDCFRIQLTHSGHENSP